ncbi:MAG: IclR family transcriptional regulator [Microbacteriaceae bacterium]
MPQSENGAHLSTLDTGLRVLGMLTTRESVTVTSVAQYLGISRSTAYRILNTLRNRGFLALGPNERGYFPGSAVIEMAKPSTFDTAIRNRLKPILDEALNLTGETVHLAAPMGSHTLLFDGRESQKPLRASLRVGYLQPSYAISAGKLFLSRMIPAQVEALYPEEELIHITPGTTKTVSQLLKELERIREQNYAITYEEAEPELIGVAVPLEGNNWRNRIALLASVPTFRSDFNSVIDVKDRLQQAAQLVHTLRKPAA